jgi:DNA invertase Pin-like site-specific DNA recombinase
MFVRAYLRASTLEQDANRASSQLQSFAAERGLTIAAWYVENESGAKLARPELFRLLADAHPGDILLVEQVDRLSRLTAEDWERLAAVARNDYVDRRRRQAQGQAKAMAEGRYKGRPEDVDRNAGIRRMLASKQSWGAIQSVTGCSRATIAKVAKRLKAAA